MIPQTNLAERSNPLAYDIHGILTFGRNSEDEKRWLTSLINEIYKADQEREGWLSHQRYLTKIRYGIRKPKTFPWKDASNLHIPLIDANIRKYKPMLFRLVVEPDPIVEFVGEDPDAVAQERKAETFYTWLFKTEMSALEPIAYLIDQMCHRGHSYIKVGWDYQTEYECRTVPVRSLFPETIPQDPAAIAQVLVDQYKLNPSRDLRVQRSLAQAVSGILQGADFVKLAYRRIIADRPAIWEFDPVQVIRPPRSTDLPNDEWICLQHVLSLRKLQRMEADGLLDPGSVAAIKSTLSTNDKTARGGGLDTIHTSSLQNESNLNDERERTWGIEDDNNVLIWEIYTWFDLDGDGLDERVVLFIHPRTRTKLSGRPYFYPFHRWPLIKFDFEKTSRRQLSPRGISHMCKDMQKEANAQHNARIDGMTLRNAPMYQIPLLAGFKARNFRCRPGEVVQVPAGARLEPILQDRGAYPEMVNEENLLRNLSESYIGLFDAAITSPSNTTKARTATEIQAVMQYTSATSTFDTILFQLAMRELHTLIWELWCDLGPEEVTFKVLGDDPKSNEPRLVTVKKSEISKKFKLIPTGTIANTNRALELANAREAMQLYLNDASGYINPYELRRWHLNLLTYRWARRILNPPDAANELSVLRQAAAALTQDERLSAALRPSSQPEPTNPPPDLAGGEMPMTQNM